jgi:hypothetical protein
MDPLQPILPHHPDADAIHALTRVDPTNRDGRGSGGQGGSGRRKRRAEDQVGDLDLQASHRDLQDAVQLAVDGLGEEPAPAAPRQLPAGDDGRPHIDLTA